MHGICILPVAQVRKEPTHKGELVNQLLFGEIYRVLNFHNDWIYIQSLHDNYVGWIDQNQHYSPGENEIQRLQGLQQKFYTTSLISKIKQTTNDTPGISQIFYISLGSILYDTNLFTIGKYTFKINKNQAKPFNDFTEDNILKITGQCIGAPYLWGGRSMMGFDCSGFVQVIYRMFGIFLPRDASQQVHCGQTVGFDELRQGNLAFFGEPNKITHVGIVAKNSKIIHCSGKVRIDNLTKEGIISLENGLLTHKLVSLKTLYK